MTLLLLHPCQNCRSPLWVNLLNRNGEIPSRGLASHKNSIRDDRTPQHGEIVFNSPPPPPPPQPMSVPSSNFLHLVVSQIQPGQTLSQVLPETPLHPDTMGENYTPTTLKGCGVKNGNTSS